LKEERERPYLLFTEEKPKKDYYNEETVRNPPLRKENGKPGESLASLCSQKNLLQRTA